MIKGMCLSVAGMLLTTSALCDQAMIRDTKGWPYTLMHSSSEGYRNPPPGTGATPKGIAFYLRRVWRSVFSPTIITDNLIPEHEVLRELASAQGEDSLTWLGHSTFLMSIEDKVILTDPFLTKRASPFSWAGPKRLAPPAIRISNLPHIDAILVSHNHFDHLDARTVEALKDKEHIQVFVPRGLRQFFSERGYSRIKEFVWGDNVDWHGIRIRSLPAIHNSGRSASTEDKTLWCAWSISSPKLKIYFAGDTAYSSSLFKETGAHAGPFDYALVPIGAYEPRSVMKSSHVKPEEAALLGYELKAKVLVAMHWGTIELSDEPFLEPPARFKIAALNFSSALMPWILDIGETRRLNEQRTDTLTAAAEMDLLNSLD
jgi:L-ascorbate metabolism protein UlaG (beta-lactamase superfamily)